MKLTITDQKTGGDLLLFSGEQDFDRLFYSRDKEKKYFTIAWNHGEKQTITIDGMAHDFMPHTIIPLMFNQSFYFERAADVVAWQFNREFYCLVDHDSEVSCSGILFFGTQDIPIITIPQDQQHKFESLYNIFIDEFNTPDKIQGDMLQMLLKRLIIICTRLAKEQLVLKKADSSQADLIRQFNFLVDIHFKTKRQVNDYALMLNKSPKTLSNIFLLYNQKTPHQIIHERVALEAKRLLNFTEKNSKEIAYDLGFGEPAHFSKFFKKLVGYTPTQYKEKSYFNR